MLNNLQERNCNRFIPLGNELGRLLVYAATCFRPPKRFHRGQNISDGYDDVSFILDAG